MPGCRAVIDSDGVTPLSAVVVIALENDLFGVTLPIGLAATGVDGTFRINYLPTLSLGEAKPDITLLLFPPGGAPFARVSIETLQLTSSTLVTYASSRERS